MLLFSKIVKHPRLFLNVPSRLSCTPWICPSFYSSQTAFVDEVEKIKPSVQYVLKKRSFSEDERRATFGKLVYWSPVRKPIYWCKILSLSTSLATIIMTPYIFFITLEQAAKTGGNYTAMIIWTVFGLPFVFTPFLLDFVTKRLVTEMYYNRDRDIYTAVFMNIFLRERALTFRLEDVKPAIATTAFMHTHLVGRNALLLSPGFYRDDETRRNFESILASMEDDEEKGDDDDNDEPAKATTDHHKRQQDQ